MVSQNVPRYLRVATYTKVSQYASWYLRMCQGISVATYTKVSQYASWYLRMCQGISEWQHTLRYLSMRHGISECVITFAERRVNTRPALWISMYISPHCEPKKMRCGQTHPSDLRTHSYCGVCLLLPALPPVKTILVESLGKLSRLLISASGFLFEFAHVDSGCVGKTVRK